ncbi:MAG TPA: hypothetical protein VN231_14905 [Allosphingosinicella sp.]|nr:hypothetical protein [Allosphingosinicella sp.]
MIRVGPSLLIELIEAYMRQTKMSSSRFGRDAVGDPNFVTGLRDGRRPRKATVQRVIAYLEAPEDRPDRRHG